MGAGSPRPAGAAAANALNLLECSIGDAPIVDDRNETGGTVKGARYPEKQMTRVGL
jgi:hypothetical protein